MSLLCYLTTISADFSETKSCKIFRGSQEKSIFLTFCYIMLVDYGKYRFFSIFKKHVRVSPLGIFWETPLNESTNGYYKLVEYHLLYSFLYYVTWPANMVEKSKIAPLWEIWIFFNFQNACPRKCCGHFLRSSTE